MLQRFVNYSAILVIVSLSLVLFPGCQQNAVDPVDPFQERNKLTFELPSDVDADLYRVSIASPEGDSVVYYERARSPIVGIAVPASDQSIVSVAAYKNNTLVFSSSTLVNAGEQTLMKLTRQSIASPIAPEIPILEAVDAKVVVGWQGSLNTELYKIYRTYDINTKPVFIGSTQSLSYADAMVTPGMAVYYRITAVNAAGESAPSGYASITVATTSDPILDPDPVPQIPAAPRNVQVSAAGSSVSISWDASTGAVSYAIYRTSRESPSLQKIGIATTVTYSDTGRSAGSTSGYAISAVNNGGESDKSSTVWVTLAVGIPAPPQTVIATAVSEKSIGVTWNSVATAESYLVQWAAEQQGPFTSATSGAAIEYVISDLSTSTLYYCRVVAVNAAGESAPSTIVSAKTLAPPLQAPAAPVLTAVSRSDTSIQISWQQVANTVSYIVEQGGGTATGPFAPVCTTATTSWTNIKLSPGTTYYFRAVATNTAGSSPASATVSATTAARLLAPTGLVRETVTDSSVTVSWQTASGAQSYKIYRSTTSGGQYTEAGTATATKFTDTGLTSSTTYYYTVSSVNGQYVSARSGSLSVTTAAAGLSAPAGLTATVASSNSITIRFSAVTGATEYKLYWSTDNGTFTALPLTSTSYTHSGLTASTTYYYKVSALKQAVESAQSAVVSAMTGAGPAAPTGLTATAASSSSISIKFTAITGASGYKLYWSADNSTFTAISLASASYTHSGLTANTTYYYKVSALQQTAESAQSAVVSVKTSAASTKIAVIGSKCDGCGECRSSCKTGAIKRSGRVYVIDAALCDGDGACIKRCEKGAISLQ